ncbi:hypothetical protein DVH24_030289 [Malus domestica]|uniref:Uncharacterized protein n=1 Tax=Malus domestica TaxID=3750 RepID=A0A498K2G6_MALDO|nr:hypothetical protein DVH24_030289 [Malus domestica]
MAYLIHLSITPKTIIPKSYIPSACAPSPQPCLSSHSSFLNLSIENPTPNPPPLLVAHQPSPQIGSDARRVVGAAIARPEDFQFELGYKLMVWGHNAVFWVRLRTCLSLLMSLACSFEKINLYQFRADHQDKRDDRKQLSTTDHLCDPTHVGRHLSLDVESGSEDAREVINQRREDAWENEAQTAELDIYNSNENPRAAPTYKSHYEIPKNPDYSEGEVSFPFSEALLDEPISDDTQALKIQSYEGLTDPYNHLNSFIYVVEGWENNDATNSHLFLTTLSRAARD